MKQYCSLCGMEMTFYYQNQSWYCHSCQDYTQPHVFPTQQTGQFPAQQAMYSPQGYYAHQPSMPYVDETVARSKIYGAMKMRDTSDKIISIRWALAILAFQIIMPVLAITLIVFFISGTTFNLSNMGQIAVIIIIFLAAVIMVIFESILTYKLVARRDEHFRRDKMMKQGMIEYLDVISAKEMKDINVERWTMNNMLYSSTETHRGPGLWALLVGLVAIIPIVGIIAMLYSLHFLTRDVHEHDQRQRDFNYQFQLAMYKMGKVDTISYDWVPMPRRDPGAYVLMSLLTLSFFMPYWWYVNIVDMNTHFRNQWHFENQLIHMTKKTEAPQVKPVKEAVKFNEVLSEP